MDRELVKKALLEMLLQWMQSGEAASGGGTYHDFIRSVKATNYDLYLIITNPSED